MGSAEGLCRLFYDTEYIPLFLYQDGTLAFKIPDTELPLEPPAYIRKQLAAGEDSIAVCYSDAECLYFLVRQDEHTLVYGGPVPMMWENRDLTEALAREYVIAKSDLPQFSDYIARIPPYPAVTTVRKANLLLCLLTGELRECASYESFVGQSDSRFRPESEQTNLLFDAHSSEYYNNSFEIETVLMRFISEGDLEGYESFIRDLPAMNVGKVAASGLRSLKNNMIISIALACRTAIAAGVPRESAYALSDAYILEIERINSANDLLPISESAMRDYILRVRQVKDAVTADATAHSRLMHRCINYIHRNLNHRITVEDVADYVHLSRSYLSTTFRSCMGVPLNRYILDEKLKEGANLLQYTDRSVASIAEYLCFSSQSHFQQAFKEKYGITPRAYRVQFPAPQGK